MGTCPYHCRSPEDCDRSCEDGRIVADEPTPGGTMSTTLDEARETVAEAMLPRLGPRNAVAWAIARQRAEAIEAISRAVFREEIARSRAPVGEDGRAAAHAFVNVDDGMGVTVVTPPAKDTGEGEVSAKLAAAAVQEVALRKDAIIAGLERQLKETRNSADAASSLRDRWRDKCRDAERERDEARSSLETAERRIGELEGHETFVSCGQWADETFGRATPLRRIERAEEEIDEAKTAPPDKLLEEIADAVICLAAAAYSAGGDLQAAIDAKMSINRKREWRLQGDGTGYHHVPAAITPDAGTARSEDEEGE